jgi:hypothetical protein
MRSVVVVEGLRADVGTEGVPMQNGQVVEVEVGIECQLPVGTFVATATEDVPRLETELLEEWGEIAEERVDVRLRPGVENRPDQTAALKNGELLEAQVGRDLAELLTTGHPDEGSLFVEVPAVVGTLEAQRRTWLFGDDGASVGADVQEGTCNAITTTHDEDRDASDLERDMISGLLDLTRSGHHDRNPAEDQLLFALVVVRVDVAAGRDLNDLISDRHRVGSGMIAEIPGNLEKKSARGVGRRVLDVGHVRFSVVRYSERADGNDIRE